MRQPRLLASTLVAFAVGALLMLLFDAPLTRVLGMLALVAFIVAGLFLIADPEGLLAGDDDDG